MSEILGDYNQTLVSVLAVGVIAVVILVTGYYLLFVMQRKPAQWKLDVEKRYRKLLAQSLDKKMILIELDKLVEYALKQKFNANNKSFGEILKQRHNSFGKKDLDAIWSAHKLRNKLVHDFHYEPRPSEINHAIILYKKVVNNFISN